MPLWDVLGIQPINFLGNATWAMPSIALATLWWGVGLPMALFLAALGQIPRELYEAAELDHASRWTVLRRITLPSIRHTMLLVLVLQIVGQFQIFGQAVLMTQGGPANRTKTIVQYIYETGFRDWQVGYASAMAMALFVLMLGFSMLQLWLGRRGDEA
jgi:multiple sugar transport system permease protein